MTKRAFLRTVAFLSGVLFFAGCGDDSEDGDLAETGVGTDAGTDVDGTTPPPPPPPSDVVMCGSNECYPMDMYFDQSLLDTFPACCVEGNTCGVDLEIARLYEVVVPDGCIAPGAPGNLDPDCPSYEYRFPMLDATTEFRGCCLSSGQCGVRADLASLALGESGEFALMIDDFGCQEAAGWFVDAPEPPSCTP